MVQPSPENRLDASFMGVKVSTAGRDVVLIVVMLVGFAGIIYVMLNASSTLNETIKWMYTQNYALQIKSLDTQQVITSEMRLAREAQERLIREVRLNRARIIDEVPSSAP